MKRSFIVLFVVYALVLGMTAGCISLPTEPDTLSLETEPPQSTTTPQETTLPEETDPPFPDPDFELTASHAFVYDLQNDIMYFVKGDPDEKVAPASLTKLFTAYAAMRYLEPDQVITAGEEVDWIDPDSSRAFIYNGQQVTADMCVEGMIVSSGNDAAYILAVAAGRAIQNDPNLAAHAAFSSFVGEMNVQVLKQGLTGTHFANPDGIDSPGHYTTMNDLVLISKLALENDLINKFAGTPRDSVTYASGQSATWLNTNLLLHSQSGYYCEYATGLKTGSTDDAGNCLLSTFFTGDAELLIGVLGCPEDTDRYRDTLQLFSHYTGIPITLPEETPNQATGS